MRLDLSICVVLYQSEDVFRQFHAGLVLSLQSFEGWEILYWDHSPHDTMRPVEAGGDARVRYFHDPRNLGFSHGNNQLILKSMFDRVLLLNPDVFGFSPDFWRHLPAACEETVTFAQLLNKDGSLQDCHGHVTGLRRALSMLPQRRHREGEAFEVGMGIMAFMLTHKAVFAKVGLLDTDYPLYAEDMDWCHRAHRHGILVQVDPSMVLTHWGGQSASSRWKQAEILRRKYLAEGLFIDKHFRGLHWALLRSLNALKRFLISFGRGVRE